MNDFNALLNILLDEARKLHERHELSETIGANYYEPGMMEFLDKYEGLYDEPAGTLLLRFESMGTRYEGRTEQIEAIKTGDIINVVRDYENAFNSNNFVLMTESNKDIGNMPAALCNAIAPLFDNGNLVFEKAFVSYVEPISARSRYAKKAVLFAEVVCKIIAESEKQNSDDENDVYILESDVSADESIAECEVHNEPDNVAETDDETILNEYTELLKSRIGTYPVENISFEALKFFNSDISWNTFNRITIALYGEKAISYCRRMGFVNNTAPKKEAINEDTDEKEEEMIIMENNVSKTRKQAKTPFEKLRNRVLREFAKVKYIGDIQISDEEYDILLEYLPIAYRRIRITNSHEIVDPLFAVTLVQIGIRNYNGRFWSHVSKYIEGGITPVQQGWIGRSFVKTLSKYNKIHLSADEMVNNILMHSFITKYYAEDFFDFLFAYYQRDLDRDLTRHTKEMRNYLIQSMKKGENSSRAYKIKKHTSDAVTANETGCKIRIRRILNFIDNYFFNGELPNSSNRVTQLFVEWAKTSKLFENAKKEYAGLGKRGQKRFSSPYMKYDTKVNGFVLVLPSQIVRLEDDEEFAQIEWRIDCSSDISTIECECDGSVTGCKTRTIKEFGISPENIFGEFRIELVKNQSETVRKFVIKSDSVRFFDEDWDMINAVSYLPVGNAYAFTQKEAEILSGSTIGVEKYHGLNLYSMSLKKGDVVKYPDGKAKSVGREFEEGMLLQHFVPGAKIIDDDSISVYSAAPLVYFCMNEKHEAGAVIEIDGKKYRFNSDNCMKFADVALTDKHGYILKLDTFGIDEGIHNVVIDIPNDRKNRNYTFAYINNFGFDFIGSPYIFKEQGAVSFNSQTKAETLDDFVWETENGFEFDILPDEDFLSFNIKTANSEIGVKIFMPVFKWKFDDGEWETSEPEVIWYTEFPKRIYLKYPEDNVRFYMNPPEIVDSSFDDSEDNYETSFVKNRQAHIFDCDTTKMPSWFGRQDPIRKLHIDFDGRNFVFAKVITKCILHGCKMDADYSANQLVLKCDISGIADCFVDVIFKDELITEKARVTTKGVRIDAPLIDGKYSVVFYEQDEEEDEFGFGLDDYAEFGKRECVYKNPYDMTNKAITVESITKKEERNSIFKASVYDLFPKFAIDNIEKDKSESLCYYGDLKAVGEKHGERVKIKIPDVKNMDKAHIYVWNKSEECWTDCIYDLNNRKLITGLNINFYLSMIDGSKRFFRISDEKYFFNVRIK